LQVRASKPSWKRKAVKKKVKLGQADAPSSNPAVQLAVPAAEPLAQPASVVEDAADLF
jgi:hypothetical protein